MQTDPQNPDESMIMKQESQEEDSVQVVCGICACTLPLAGKRVADARELFSGVGPIPADAVPILDGKRVSEDAVLTAGQCLAFIHARGEIGSRAAFGRVTPSHLP